MSIDKNPIEKMMISEDVYNLGLDYFDGKTCLLFDKESRYFMEGVFTLVKKSTDFEFYLDAFTYDGVHVDPLDYGILLINK